MMVGFSKGLAASTEEISSGLGIVLNSSEVALTSLRLPSRVSRPAVGSRELASTASEDRHRSMDMGMRWVVVTGVGGAEMGCIGFSWDEGARGGGGVHGLERIRRETAWAGGVDGREWEGGLEEEVGVADRERG